MYELIQAGERTYYISCPTNIGIYKIDNTGVCVIDSGNDKDYGRRILRILEANGWELKMIINTHAHADHIGGNEFLQKRTGCKIYAPETDIALVHDTILNASLLYGGSPCRDMLGKFFYAKGTNAELLTPDVLPDGMEMTLVPGHSLTGGALKTPDGVWFLGDSVIGENIIQKHRVQFLYNVENALDSIEKIKTFEGKMFIPSHSAALEDVKELCELNRACIEENFAFIHDACTGISFEDILKKVMDHNGLEMSVSQYLLIGSTVRSYLSYMKNNGLVDIECKDNRLLWRGVVKA